MFMPGPFELMIVALMAVVAIGFLVLVIRSLMSLGPGLKRLRGKSPMLTCWHCGKETEAHQSHCQHCNQELK